MSGPSPIDAAVEGFRLLRREPKAVLVWAILWFAALSIAAVSTAFGGRVVVAHPVGRRTIWDIVSQFGPFAIVFISLFLLVWATTTVAAFRAVLRPSSRRFFFLRLGADEGRLAVMTISALVLVLVAGGTPALLLFALVSPLMAAAPTLARDLATLGAIATVAIDIWLAVRLSLIAVETFAERRFHLSAYWPLTRGRFWYLLASYALCFVIFFGFLGLFALSGVVLGKLQSVVGLPHGADPLRRLLLLGLAGVLAALTSGFFVVTTTLFCACQANAFRAIVASQDQKVGRLDRSG